MLLLLIQFSISSNQTVNVFHHTFFYLQKEVSMADISIITTKLPHLDLKAKTLLTAAIFSGSLAGIAALRDTETNRRKNKKWNLVKNKKPIKRPTLVIGINN